MVRVVRDGRRLTDHDGLGVEHLPPTLRVDEVDPVLRLGLAGVLVVAVPPPVKVSQTGDQVVPGSATGSRCTCRKVSVSPASTGSTDAGHGTLP